MTAEAHGAAAFDSEAAAFVESHAEGCEILACEDIEVMGFISSASNGTMLVRLGDADARRFAIYKPAQHERPLWDFPGELFRREIATYELSAYLGWDLVPPTVERDGPRGPGSIQLFVPHDPAEHYFELVDDHRWASQLVRMALFDMVCNNADRKGGHVLHQTDTDRLYGIDHGLTFHEETKLRTVIWDLPDVPFEESDKADLVRLHHDLEQDATIAHRLHELLTVTEVDTLRARTAVVRTMTAMPRIDPDDRWYPWPPV